MSELDLLVGGVDFGEGPRWHDGLFWYSDFHQRAVYTVDLEGNREAVHSGFDDRPSGLGWLPDGSLLVVSMTRRLVLRHDPGADGADERGFVVHADCSALAPWHCNDMVVAANGDAYVGNFGFDLEGGADPVPTTLLLVRPDGTVDVADDGVGFPNGSVITPDGSTLIVGESFGQTYQAWTIADDGTLTDRRTWAETPGMAPDGCTLDADGGIWFSDAVGSQVVRVVEGGEITHRVTTPQKTFACALGGDDGRTLFVLTAPGSHPDRVAGRGEGGVWTMRVDVPHAGLP